MNELPRQKLSEIVATYGRSISEDARRCENLLWDLCGGHRREINALVAALKQRVPADLLGSGRGMAPHTVMARLTRQMQEDQGLTEDVARWAVESWALALGVVSQDQLPTLKSGLASRSSGEKTPGAPPANPPRMARPRSPAPILIVLATLLTGGLIGTAAGIWGRHDPPGSQEHGGPSPNPPSPPSAPPAPTPLPAPPRPVETGVTVPRLANLTESQARSSAGAKKLKLAVTREHSDGVPRNRIISQVPAAGTTARQSDTIQVRVSDGPRPPKTRFNDVAEIRELYYAWLDAWQSRDVGAYMRFYSPRVLQKRAGKPPYGYTALQQNMSRTWAKQSFISIDSSAPSIRFDGDIALVRAFHNYNSSTWWDRGIKRMAWRKEKGTWRIVEESFQKQAGGPKR